VDVAAVCDAYQPNLEAGLKEASTGARPLRDYRRLPDDKSIDAVIVATPDHWHARMVIDAVELGKDVYVEKPLAQTIPGRFRNHRLRAMGSLPEYSSSMPRPRRATADGWRDLLELHLGAVHGQSTTRRFFCPERIRSIPRRRR